MINAPSDTGRYDNNVAFVSLGLLGCGSDTDIFLWEANYYCGDGINEFGKPTGDAFIAETYFYGAATKKEAYILCFANDGLKGYALCALTEGASYATFVIDTENLSFRDGPFDLSIISEGILKENEQSDKIQAGIGPEFAHIYDSYGGQWVWKIWHYDDANGKTNWFWQDYYDVYVMQYDGYGGTYSFYNSVYLDYPFYADGAAKMASVAIALSTLLSALI